MYVRVVLLLLMACSATDEDSRRVKCERVRDHLVELRLQTASPGVDVSGHRSAMKQALGHTFVDRCEQDLSAAQVTCVLRARDHFAASACTGTASN
jgi:hypothetical protein